jgi:hypothetical protein
MYATLNAGTVNRSLTTADLNVADSDATGACGLHVAGWANLLGTPANAGGTPAFGSGAVLWQFAVGELAASLPPEGNGLLSALAKWTAHTDLGQPFPDVAGLPVDVPDTLDRFGIDASVIEALAWQSAGGGNGVLHDGVDLDWQFAVLAVDGQATLSGPLSPFGR